MHGQFLSCYPDAGPLPAGGGLLPDQRWDPDLAGIRRALCLFVDELLGEQQVVVKPLPSYLSRFNIKQSGIAGCTILGDGNISIILDISNLYTPA